MKRTNLLWGTTGSRCTSTAWIAAWLAVGLLVSMGCGRQEPEDASGGEDVAHERAGAEPSRVSQASQAGKAPAELDSPEALLASLQEAVRAEDLGAFVRCLPDDQRLLWIWVELDSAKFQINMSRELRSLFTDEDWAAEERKMKERTEVLKAVALRHGASLSDLSSGVDKTDIEGIRALAERELRGADAVGLAAGLGEWRPGDKKKAKEEGDLWIFPFQFRAAEVRPAPDGKPTIYLPERDVAVAVVVEGGEYRVDAVPVMEWRYGG